MQCQECITMVVLTLRMKKNVMPASKSIVSDKVIKTEKDMKAQLL